MTLAQVSPSSRKTLRWPIRRSGPISEEELQRFWDLAEQLQGRPLPGVRVTEKEFEARYWDEDLNAEWVDGEVIVMAPVSGEHSDLNIWLLRLFCEFVDHHDLGIVRAIEFQIRLAAVRQRRNPDVLFISKSRLSKLRPTYLEGAPDLAMEIVSPDSVARDWREKHEAYEASGVREYWIVDPTQKRVEAYALGRGKRYSLIDPDGQGRIRSKVLRGLYIRPEWLWQSPLPKLSTVLKELGLRK